MGELGGVGRDGGIEVVDVIAILFARRIVQDGERLQHRHGRPQRRCHPGLDQQIDHVGFGEIEVGDAVQPCLGSQDRLASAGIVELGSLEPAGGLTDDPLAYLRRDKAAHRQHARRLRQDPGLWRGGPGPDVDRLPELAPGGALARAPGEELKLRLGRDRAALGRAGEQVERRVPALARVESPSDQHRQMLHRLEAA